MASLNTLRTKYGIVLSVVIALVLVAFILGDQLSMRGGQNTEIQDNVVLTIDGQEVKQSEYAKYQEKFATDGADADQVASLIYTHILFDKYIEPAFEEVGLGYSEADKDAFLAYITREIANSPEAQSFTREQLVDYINYQWMMMQPNLDMVIANTKAASVYAAGKFANRLEVEEALRTSNLKFDGRYVMVPYSAIEAQEATEEEITAYYNAHRTANPRYGARTLRYVSFPLEASAEDIAAIEKAVMDADAAAKAATDAKGIKNAVRSVNGKISNKYVAVSSLDEEVAKALKNGNSYGPVQKEDSWTAMYILSKINAPESYKFDAITVDSNEAAEQLIADIKAVEGDLTKLEAGANAVSQSVKMTDMNETEAAKFIDAKVGDLFVYAINNKPAVVKITEVGKKENFVLTANVDKKIEASDETKDSIIEAAEKFMAEAGSTPEKFEAAALAIKEHPYSAEVSRGENPAAVRPAVSGINNSRSLAVWAFDAKVGQKKNFFADNVFYVCMVTAINNDKYTPKNDFIIKRELESDKKFAAVKETLTMDTTIEGAVSGKFADITFASNNVDGKYDAAFVGAIARTTEVDVPTVVKGNNGVYVFVVENIEGEDKLNDVDNQRKLMNNSTKVSATQSFLPTITDEVKVVDKRGVGEL